LGQRVLQFVLARGQALLPSLAALLNLGRSTRRFDNSISAEIASAGALAGAAGAIDAAAIRGKSAVASEFDAVGSIAQDGMIYLFDAIERQTGPVKRRPA